MFDSTQQTTQLLVCIVTRPAEMQHIREQGCYRIPLQHAPRGLAVSYLAFYLTAAFGKQRWAIHEYAEVLSVSIARRCEILPEQADHPRAQQRYLRYSLGPLQALAVAVPSRRLRRITFIPTSLEQLLSARDVSELWQSRSALGAEALWAAGIGRRSLH